jgi:hypothetical protein
MARFVITDSPLWRLIKNNPDKDFTQEASICDSGHEEQTREIFREFHFGLNFPDMERFCYYNMFTEG